MYSVSNTLSEYTYFCISKDITSYTFLLVFEIVESLQCIIHNNSSLLAGLVSPFTISKYFLLAKTLI